MTSASTSCVEGCLFTTRTIELTSPSVAQGLGRPGLAVGPGLLRMAAQRHRGVDFAV